MSRYNPNNVAVDSRLLDVVMDYNIPGCGGMPYESGVKTSAEAIFGNDKYNYRK